MLSFFIYNVNNVLVFNEVSRKPIYFTGNVKWKPQFFLIKGCFLVEPQVKTFFGFYMSLPGKTILKQLDLSSFGASSFWVIPHT